MIIDFHTHTFPDKIATRAIDKLSHEAHLKPHTDGTVSDLASHNAATGIDLSVILPVATSPEQVVNINDSALKINEEMFSGSSGLLSFASMHPDFGEYKKELLRIKEHGFKGIKLHPVYQKTDIDDIRSLRILNFAAELDLIVLTHAGLDVAFLEEKQCTPEKCRNAYDEIGPFKFVLAHMGGWRCWKEVVEYFTGTKVWIDTSFSLGEMDVLTDGYWREEDKKLLSAEECLDMVNTLGADRFLFGTDSPWSDQKKSIDFINALPLSDKEKHMIFYENAAKLLDL